MGGKIPGKPPNTDLLIEYFWKTTTGKIGMVLLSVLLTAIGIVLASITWTQISLAIVFAFVSVSLFILSSKSMRSRLLLFFRATMLAATGHWVKENPLGFQDMMLANAKAAHDRSRQKLDRDEVSKNSLKHKVAANDAEIQALIVEVKAKHEAGDIETAGSLAIRVAYKKRANVGLRKILAEQESRLRKARERFVARGCEIEQKEAAYDIARQRLQATDGAIEDDFASQAEMAELSRIADEEIETRIDASTVQLDAAVEARDLEDRFANLSADAALADILGDSADEHSMSRIRPLDTSSTETPSVGDEVEEHNAFLRR